MKISVGVKCEETLTVLTALGMNWESKVAKEVQQSDPNTAASDLWAATTTMNGTGEHSEFARLLGY